MRQRRKREERKIAKRIKLKKKIPNLENIIKRDFHIKKTMEREED